MNRYIGIYECTYMICILHLAGCWGGSNFRCLYAYVYRFKSLRVYVTRYIGIYDVHILFVFSVVLTSGGEQCLVFICICI